MKQLSLEKWIRKTKKVSIPHLFFDFKGNYKPNLCDLIALLYNCEPINGNLLKMNPIPCRVCNRVSYVNRYGKTTYNKSVICVFCRKNPKKRSNSHYGEKDLSFWVWKPKK